MPCTRALLFLLTWAQLAGCSPTLDWREVRPPESQLVLLFPCKPSAQERSVPLARQPVRLTLHACSAGGLTWGLVSADVADPARTAPALADFVASVTANIAGSATSSTPLRVPGATPNPGSQRLLLQGKLPDGRAVSMQVAVFTHGTRVFQATVLGEQLSPEVAEVFFDGLRIQP